MQQVSFVQSGDCERLVGVTAKHQVRCSDVSWSFVLGVTTSWKAASNPKNTVNDAKRLIGRLWSDQGLQVGMLLLLLLA